MSIAECVSRDNRIIYITLQVLLPVVYIASSFICTFFIIAAVPIKSKDTLICRHDDGGAGDAATVCLDFSSYRYSRSLNSPAVPMYLSTCISLVGSRNRVTPNRSRYSTPFMIPPGHSLESQLESFLCYLFIRDELNPLLSLSLILSMMIILSQIRGWHFNSNHRYLHMFDQGLKDWTELDIVLLQFASCFYNWIHIPDNRSGRVNVQR